MLSCFVLLLELFITFPNAGIVLGLHLSSRAPLYTTIRSVSNNWWNQMLENARNPLSGLRKWVERNGWIDTKEFELRNKVGEQVILLLIIFIICLPNLHLKVSSNFFRFADNASNPSCRENWETSTFWFSHRYIRWSAIEISRAKILSWRNHQETSTELPQHSCFD